MNNSYYLFFVPGLRRLESCSHSRQRCERCLERSFSQLTVRRAQKTMSRSCSDNTNSHHHNHCLTLHNLHNAHHNPSARVHSLDTPKVTEVARRGGKTFTQGSKYRSGIRDICSLIYYLSSPSFHLFGCVVL